MNIFPPSVQVAFRANFSGSVAESLSIDDLILRLDACDHPAECDFTDGLCGYVNKFDGCFRWLVGTGRLENPHLYRGAPVPQGRSSTFAYLDLTTDRAEDESEEEPKQIKPIALQSPIFDVADGGINVAIEYFRKGFDISTANLSVSCYNDGASPKLEVVHQLELDEVSVWTTANVTLEKGAQCQLVIQVVRGAWTNGTMAIGRIKVTKSQPGVHPKPASSSAMHCTFEDRTTCGWNPNGASLPWVLNNPTKHIPNYPRFDHTLRAYRGRFVFASIGKNKSFGTAELKSPDLEINATDGACLSFWHFTDHDKRAHITVLADGRFLFGSGTRKNHRWNHVLVAFKVPTPKFKLQIQVHLESGLIGLDDIQITEGTCPLRDFCPFEPAYSCPMHQGAGSFTPWIPLIAQEIGIPDNTLKNLKGYYLYLNTTAVRSHHPASRVFMATRPPTEATCVTFWWRGRGIPSQLNVYRFTKETAMRDPLLSVSTRDEEDWWNVRTLTIKSKRKWNLVFEVIAAEDERRESGVMIDDVEFADGECPKYEFCTFEEECLPWLVLNRDDDASFEPQRAGSFPQLPRDHTTQTEDGYYLLYKSPGVRGNHSTLVLRDTTRYRCASLWYYLPAMTNGVQLLLKDNPVEEPKGVWKRQQFSYPSGWMNAVRAVSGSNPSGFVAVDDVLVNELHCDELGRSTQMFDCGNKQTVLVERVCDFVVDCRNGADERNCGQCDFSEGTCGWNLNWYRNGDTMAWRRERIGYVSGSPRIGADTRHTGHYLMLYSNLTKSQLTGQAAIISPMIRNTDKLCTMRFWFNYVNNGSSTDVELIMELDPYELSIWTLSALNRAPEQGVWNEAIIAIGRYKRDIRFQFSSTQWPQGRALFAVDSIHYSGCALPARHNNCTKMDFSCANGACVSRHERCNYVDDCGDNSDEQGCWDHRLGCNFDTSFCDWVPGVPWDEDQDTWALKPPGPSLLTSPTRDHTTGSPDGNFVILRTHAKATNATLYGPSLDNTENCSITFFYTVQGKSEPQLTLNVRSAKDGPWKTVWKQSEPTQFWHFVAATVDFMETNPYQVAFTGDHRASGQEGYIAIDDVTFTETCKTYDKELPPAPTPTFPPSACGADMFRCGDNEECIPLAQVCDFKEHCSNGMDEARCGACDFSQDLCGLENEDPNGRFGWNWTMAQIGKNNNIFPSTDSRLDEGGAYAAYCLLNPDVPLGAPRAMVTPRLGQVAHSCTVSFYVYVPDASSSILIFGVLPKSATSTASSTAHQLSVLTGRVQTGRWTKASIKTGNWDAGARFFYEAGAPGMSIDQTKYLNCHPDTQSEGWEASRHVSCDFSAPLDCGWFPERSAATLRWVLYTGGAGTARLRWQPTDSGARNGAYMYARNRFFQEKIAHLVSVRMSPTPENGRCFTFWYNMWHPNLGQLNLLRRVDNATSILWSRSGPQGKAWQQAQIPVLSDDPFQLVFEAILKPQNPGMIAIDNFELKNGSCDAKNVCTFETGSCGWELHNWEVTKGSSVMLPTADHGSQSAVGGFALVNPPNGRMVSPPGSYDTRKNRCLRFWFFIAGATETLNVTQVVDDQQKDALWFGTRVDAPTERWYSAAVALTSYQGSVSTVFEGTTSGGAGTAVAVDDISHGEKPCPPPGSCSFEEDMCNWHNAEDLNHMQWYRHSGRTVSGSSDLENDRTLGSREGHYLLLDSEDMSEKRFGSLQSQTLNFGPAVCFKLYYNMKKGSDASLKIKFLDSSGAPSGEQKTVLATAPTEWTLLSVERHDLPKHFSIVITGSTGSSSGDLGIDDIDVHPGKCDSSKVITVSPQPGVSTTHVSTHPYNTESMASSVTGLPVPSSEITAAPITSTSGYVSSPVPLPRCARGQFNCRDGATCIPSMLLCDGVRDCPNGIDEKCANANACTSDEFLCTSRTPSSCLPRYVLCDGKEDCFGGADEYLCRECPHFLCLNGGLCWWSVREPYPSCNCSEDYEGRRCQINKKHELEDKPQELQDVGSNGPIVTGVLVVLAFVLIGAVVVVAVLRRRRAERLNTPMCISNPSFNAQAEETQTAT
ncbi:MAM and LDL-receptor class A domain-containing protein 1-like [Dermacentor variabilis]|uniref:MAM and LDL-receptor class A domain-containing protein 1-like n=1 Tax=Dermacentor variabilis TaxID=34621 RepID=UPI003F5B8EB0